MKTNEGRIAPEYMPRLPRTEATTRLHKAVLSFSLAASNFLATDREGQPPVKVIKAEAGLGKSTATLAEIQKRFLAEIKKELRGNPALRILYMVPSLDLADELAAKALADYGIEARVMRGRSQRQPNSTATMCAKSEIAETLASLNVSVSTSLCRKEDDQGNISECPHYATCPYIAQMQAAKQGGLIIASHQYLSVKMEALKDVDWLIIDESFWQVLTAQRLVDLGRFTTYRGVGEGFRGRKGESHQEFEQRQACASEQMIDGIARFTNVIENAAKADRQPTLADFAAEGFTPEECDNLATLEYSRINKPEITPSMSEEAQRDVLQKAHIQEAFGFVRVWKILAAELATSRQGEAHGLVMEYGVLNPKSGELGNFIHAFWSRDPRFKEIPTLIIDADADAEIVGRFYPTAETVEIAAEWRNVEIVQVSDKTGSAQSLKGERRRDEAYNTALDMADRLAHVIGNDPTRRPLLVSQKAVIEAYKEAGDLAHAPFDTAWFGNTRGKDQWKNTAGLVVAGRIEPSPQALEQMARSIWFASEEPLAFLEPDQEGRLMLPKCQHSTTAKNGQTATVAVSYHPDRRADRVLRQVREAELMQAIARVRPIHRGADNPCQIVILTNVPLPIQPDRLATWAEIVPDRFDLMRLAGFIPEKSNDAADMFPTLWTAPTAVRMAASRRAERAFPAFAGGCNSSHISINMEGVTPSSSWVRVSYERPAKVGSRGGATWVRLEAGDTLQAVSERVRAVLPDASDFDAIIPETAPQGQPEAAERRQTRDDRTGFRIVSRTTITRAQINADALPRRGFNTQNHGRKILLTTRVNPPPIGFNPETRM